MPAVAPLVPGARFHAAAAVSENEASQSGFARAAERLFDEGPGRLSA